jgi:hypothetical protein
MYHEFTIFLYRGYSVQNTHNNTNRKIALGDITAVEKVMSVFYI